jgi:Cu/Ag efflux protein CusF
MKPKSRLVVGIFSLALFLPLASQAGDEAPAGDKPSISATQKVQLTTIVEALDLETRQITLKGPQGNSRTITASEEAKNLDQIDVGDQVNVEYVQHMSIEVFANDGMVPGAGTMSATARNTEDEAPGAMMMETTVASATVEEINLEANSFKLKWPGGEIKQYEAQDPENLRKAAVGDLVVTTYTEAIAIYLNEVPAE